MPAHWTDTFFEGEWDTIIRKVYTPEESLEEARFIRQALRLRPGSRVLDAPCGDGRISLALAGMGCRVTGVDACVPSVRRARRLARARRWKQWPPEFHVGDMRELEVRRPFKAVLNWWGSFGYFDDPANLSMLMRFSELLSRGGRVLIDQINREWMLRNFRAAAWDDYGPVRVHVRNRWDPSTQRIEGSWTMVRDGERQVRRSSMRMYTPRQMERLLGRAGLELERLYGGVSCGPHTRGSRRMVTVARKP
ncbi:MAG: class I SAM-dependent methyltransferase [Candidatus Eisenbacteria bacterium]